MLPLVLRLVRRGSLMQAKPPEPSRRQSILYGNPARVVGVAALSLGIGLLISRASRTSNRAYPVHDRIPLLDQRSAGRTATRGRAARLLFSGSTVLSFAGAADSGLEHYRGKFTNPAMFLAPAVSVLSLFTSASQTLRAGGTCKVTRIVYWLSAATGLSGLGFHLYNIGKRAGRFRITNLFYGAPLMAPGTQFAAGAFGLIGEFIVRRLERGRRGPPVGRVLGAGTAVAMVGTTAEATFLHYRGAFQNPYMILPATVPPVAAVALLAAACKPTRGTIAAARTLSGATAALGLLGTIFHAYGIHRNMGGWRNWSQMILQGPPLPAPPGFTGVAIAALAAMNLLEEET